MLIQRLSLTISEIKSNTLQCFAQFSILPVEGESILIFPINSKLNIVQCNREFTIDQQQLRIEISNKDELIVELEYKVDINENAGFLPVFQKKPNRAVICTTKQTRFWLPLEETQLIRECEIQFPADAKEAKKEVFCTGHRESDAPIRYSISLPLQAQFIGFAIGKMEIVSKDNLIYRYDVAVMEQQHLPRINNQVPQSANYKHDTYLNMAKNVHTVIDVPELILEAEQYLGDLYPFKQFRFLFVDELYRDCLEFANFIVCPSTLLFGVSMIENVYDSIEQLYYVLFHSWTEATLRIQSLKDRWIIEAIAYSFQTRYSRKHFGRTHVEMKAIQSMEYIIAQENPEMSDNQYFWPLQALSECDNVLMRPLLREKAWMIVYILKYRFGEKLFDDMLFDVIDFAMLDADHPDRVQPISTQTFYDMACKRLNGSRGALTQLQYIWQNYVESALGPGDLILEYGIDYKKKNIRAVITQPHFSNPFNIKLRIVETQRQSEIYREILDSTNEYEFWYTSGTNRNRTRRQFAKQDLNRLTTEQLLTRYNDTPLVYLRVNTDHTGFGLPKIETTKMMLLQQLIREKYLQGQYESLVALQENFIHLDPTDENPLADGELNMIELCQHALVEVLTSKTHYYPIRCKVVEILAQASIHYPTFCSILFRYFTADSQGKPKINHLDNDFQDIPEYYVKKEIIKQLALIRTLTNGTSPRDVVDFYVNLLENYNNGTNGVYSDHHYLETLLTGLGNLQLTPLYENGDTDNEKDDDSDDDEMKNDMTIQSKFIAGEIERFYFTDQIIYSSHSQRVAGAALSAYYSWKFKQQWPRTEKSYFQNMNCFHNVMNHNSSLHLQLVSWKCCIQALAESNFNSSVVLQLVEILENCKDVMFLERLVQYWGECSAPNEIIQNNVPARNKMHALLKLHKQHQVLEFMLQRLCNICWPEQTAISPSKKRTFVEI
jgi:hypothetical protein